MTNFKKHTLIRLLKKCCSRYDTSSPRSRFTWISIQRGLPCFILILAALQKAKASYCVAGVWNFSQYCGLSMIGWVCSSSCYWSSQAISNAIKIRCRADVNWTAEPLQQDTRFSFPPGVVSRRRVASRHDMEVVAEVFQYQPSAWQYRRWLLRYQQAISENL